MGTSWKGPYVEQLIHSVSGMLSWKYPEIYVHRLFGKGRGGGSWTCRTFTCGFRNLYQCGRGSHWSELDYIMHKEDNKWPWIMPTLRGRQKNRNWWTSPGMSFCWGWRRTRQGQGSGHQVGRAFQEGTCMPSAREYYRETIGFCRWVRMAREKGMGKSNCTGPLQVQCQRKDKWKAPWVNQVREWLWNMKMLAFCKQKEPNRNKIEL